MVPIHTHLFLLPDSERWCMISGENVSLERSSLPLQLGLPGHLPLFQGSPKRLWGRGRLEAFFLRADPVEETCEAKIDFDHPTDVEWILRPESERWQLVMGFKLVLLLTWQDA